jgi:thiol-disulfide isomerase/thioredoxin
MNSGNPLRKDRLEDTQLKPSVTGPHRRALLRGGVGAVASLATNAAAAMFDPDVPHFESGRYQFIVRPPREVPAIKLFRLQGATTDLSSLRGRPILLNFWATWCAACKAELPILDRLCEANCRTGLYVLAVSTDRTERQDVDRFVKMLKLRSLPIYLDPNGYVAFSDKENKKNAPFALYGMPITYLISASGLIVGYMPGAADWTSDSASKLIEYLRRS